METSGQMKKPSSGGRVRIFDPWTETTRHGVVQSILDTQFTYVDDEDGHTYFCTYNGDWQEVTDEPGKV